MEHGEGCDAMTPWKTGKGVILCLMELGEGCDAMTLWNIGKGVML